MKKIKFFIFRSNSPPLLFASILIAILLAAIARSGMRDAFFYKKTKRQKKIEWAALSAKQKLTLPFSALKPTNAPHHMRLFWTFRLSNGLLIALISIVVLATKTIYYRLEPYANLFILIKALLVDFPFLVYSIFHPSGNPESAKGWNFDSCRNP